MKKIKIPGILLLGLLPVLAHVALLGKYVQNFPLKDDYRVFVNYMYHFLNAPDKLAAVALPENESRPVLLRLITLFQYGVDGQQNFSHMLLLCNLFLVLFSTCLMLHFYRRKEYIYMTWTSLLVFNLMHYEMYFRNDVGAYQLLSFALSIFLFYSAAYYHRLGKFLRILFFLVFLITPLGSINGILANVLVVTFFLLDKNYRKTGLAMALVLAAQLAMMLGGEKGLNVFENIEKYNFQLVYAYFLSLGGIFNLISQPLTWVLIAVVSGGVFAYTFYSLFFPFEFKLDFEKLLFIFCTVSLALIVILRYNYWMQGYVSVLESRYKIYGAMVILLFFILLSRRFASARWLKGGVTLFLAGLFMGGLYKGLQSLKLQQLEQITEAYNVYEGAYKEDYARDFYVNKERRKYLEQNGVYSFNEASALFSGIFSDQNRLSEITSARLERLDFDPISEGDWVGMPVGMSNFEARGTFPVKKYYFVKFNAPDSSASCVQFLGPPSASFLEKIGKKNETTVPFLSKDFYAEAYEGIDFNNFELYGTDDLGL